MAKPSDLDPELVERYHADLLATLRRVDLLDAEKKETAKLLRGCIDEEWGRVRVLRDLLEGRISEQAALPGLEGPGERETRIGAVLRRAVEAAESITGVETEPEEKPKKGPRARDVDPIAAELEERVAEIDRAAAGDARRAANVLGEARAPKAKKGGRRG